MIPNVLVSISGLPKTGKNHLAYSFPKPIKVYCFNGGADFVRAKFPNEAIDVHNFVLPIVESTDMEWALPVWNEFYQEYKEDVLSKAYQTVLLDTSTEAENICQQSVLEELQAAASERNRTKEKLATTEFLARNLKMKAIFDLAKNNGVNLVVLNYLKEKWIKLPGEKQAQNTGELVLDGWQRTESQVDINIEMSTKEKTAVVGNRPVRRTVMVATIKNNRFDRDQNGQQLEDTTYNEIIALLLGDA